MADRIITREVLHDWVLNDGLEHLFAEGYLTPGQVDKSDYVLRDLVTTAYVSWQQYQSRARAIEELVG
jgi:hypothetical protein